VYGFLRTPRWIALTLIVVLVIPSFIVLSRWQWSRYEERSTRNAAISTNESVGAEALGSVVSPGDAVGPDREFRVVRVSGTYSQSGERYSRRQPLNGTTGFFVLTPLLTNDGRVVLVNRGWTGTTGSAIASPTVDAAPTGPVVVEGRLRAGETNVTQPSDVPAGQVVGVDSAAILADAGRPAYPGYIELTAQAPAPDPLLAPIPAPDLGEGPHRSYALQWLLFIGIAIIGWGILVRNEAIRRREVQTDAGRAVPDPRPAESHDQGSAEAQQPAATDDPTNTALSQPDATAPIASPNS